MSEELQKKYPKFAGKVLGGLFPDLEEFVKSVKTDEEFQILEDLCQGFVILRYMYVLKRKYVDFYGNDFFFKYLTELETYVLDLGMKSEHAFEVIMLFGDNDLSVQYIPHGLMKNEKICKDSVERIIPLFKDKKYTDLLVDKFKYTDKGVEFLEKAVAGEEFEKTILDFMVEKFTGRYGIRYPEKLVEKEDRESIYKMMKLMPDEYFTDKSEVIDFVALFEKIEKLLKDIDLSEIDNYEIKNNFRTYIMDNMDFGVVDTKEKLLNISNIRYDFYKNKIENCNNLEQIRNFITKNYFNMNYSTYLSKMKEIEHLDFKTYFFPVDSYNEYSDVLKISKLNSKSGLLELYKNLKDKGINSYFDKMNKKVRSAYQNDFVNRLTKLPRGRQIIEYNGEDFAFLVHKIVGFGDKEMAAKIYENPEIWKDGSKSYLDVSLVNEEYMGVADGSGFMFIFDDIKPSEFVAMGLYDIYTNQNNVGGGVVNSEEEWMLMDELKKKVISPFDNHAIKKDDNDTNKIFMPSGVLCFDKVNEKAEEVSQIFDIPIVVINRESYMDIKEEKLQKALKDRDGEEYYRIKIQMCMAIRDNKELLEKYFADKKMYNEACDFIRDMSTKKSDMDMLSSLLKANLQVTCRTGGEVHFYGDRTYEVVNKQKRLLKQKG